MLLTFMWLVVAAIMFVVVAAAMRIQDDTRCLGYEINIQSLEKGNAFTSIKNIEALVKRAANGEVKGQKLSTLNLLQIEDLLEQSPWVLDAEIYIDNFNKLQIKIKERIPLARIFTTQKESFYFDGLGRMIPLSDEVTMDVPVFTGFVNKKVMLHSDSVLVQNIIATANFIVKDSFWNAQVSEINIEPCGRDCWNFSMIPVVGNHHVMLGDGSDIASKFHRLYLFYDQVLKNIGFDKYKKIDVQYANQVVAERTEFNKIDSIALRKNISDLLVQVRNMNDAIEDAASVPVGERYKLDSISNISDSSNELLFKDSDLISTVVPKAKVPEVKNSAIENKNISSSNKETKKEVPEVKKATAKSSIKPTVENKKVSSSSKGTVKKSIEVKAGKNPEPKKEKDIKSTSKKTVSSKTEVKKRPSKAKEPTTANHNDNNHVSKT
ncbi:MAG: FtsQ-type POTRA domain-containing protein, partial [Chitinophagaceae bacterium]